MPDLQEFGVTREDAAQVNVPVHNIHGKVVEDSPPFTLLADFTGDNAIHWPGVLATLTAEQQDTIAQGIANQIILLKAGF